ncbi:MAG: fibronectin type III domain-containing protein [Myxococcales bacterium]|nr:fibronectin type III domain-containing protein [Myxococcales bacterium]
MISRSIVWLSFIGVTLLACVASAQNQPPQFGGVTSVENTGTGFSLLVRWNAATDLEGDGVSYRVYVSTEPGQFKFGGPHLITDQLQATIEGLTTGTTYYVVVRAVDSQGAEETNFEILSGKPDAGPYRTGFSGCQLSRSGAPGEPPLAALLLVAFLVAVSRRTLRTSATRHR